MAARMGQAGMSGDLSGTSGGNAGTNGKMPLPLAGLIAGFLLLAILVNISSNVIEVPDRPLWEPATWELSSYIAIIIYLPALYWAWHRFHWTRLGVPRFLTLQGLAFVLFSAGHIAVMVLLRKGVYALLHDHYNFSRGHLPLEIVYESRKDFMTFLVIGGMFWAYERIRTPPAAPSPQRLEVHTDGRTLFLAVDDILMAASAGNYVELHLTQGKPLLLRATLNAYQDRLGAGFARVHRSKLVNRRHIREIAVTASGDPHLVLSDGREVAGSRRYRANLS